MVFNKNLLQVHDNLKKGIGFKRQVPTLLYYFGLSADVATLDYDFYATGSGSLKTNDIIIVVGGGDNDGTIHPVTLPVYRKIVRDDAAKTLTSTVVS